jgi:hypothetical protein
MFDAWRPPHFFELGEKDFTSGWKASSDFAQNKANSCKFFGRVAVLQPVKSA